MCRFDGKETCQLRVPARPSSQIGRKTTPSVRIPLSFFKSRRGALVRVLTENSIYSFRRAGGMRPQYTDQSALKNPRL